MDYQSVVSLIEQIESMIASQGERPNFWLLQQRDAWAQFLEENFTPDGDVADLPEPVLLDEISPVEVVGAGGWFEDQGLKLSLARHMGGFLIFQQHQTATYYRDHVEEISTKYGASPRLITMLANAILAHEWNMLPTHTILGAGNFARPYTPINPPVPFNEQEKALWEKNWFDFHSTGEFLVSTKLHPRPLVVDGDNRDHRDDGPMMWVKTNSPDAVIPELATRMSKPFWLRDQYSAILRLARDIDAGRKTPIFGYQSPEQVGGETSMEWYAAVEPSNVTKRPRLELAL